MSYDYKLVAQTRDTLECGAVESVLDAAVRMRTQRDLYMAETIRLREELAGLEQKFATMADRCVRESNAKVEAREFAEKAAQQYNELLAASQVVTCAYCGEQYPRGTPRHGDGALDAHIKICAQHPVQKLLGAIRLSLPLIDRIIEQTAQVGYDAGHPPVHDIGTALRALMQQVLSDVS